MKKFIQGFANAFRGIGILIRTERNFQIHCVALAAVLFAGIYYAIKSREFIMIFIVSALVLSLEALNTALEKLCDEVTLDRKESIRNIKDIAAGAVLIGAIFAVVIAAYIFIPHIMGWKPFRLF